MLRRLFLAFVLFVGIVLSPLRAMAATVPVHIAYDAAVGPTATTVLGTYGAVGREAEHRPINTYDPGLLSYDGASNPRVAASVGPVHAYDDALEHAHRRDVRGEGPIYDSPVITPAAKGAVTVTQEGLAAVGEHLAHFGEHAPNTAMLDRLAGQVGSAVTGADANFYTHELLEAGHMASGMSYEAAHAAALEQAGVSPFSLYHPEVIQQFPAEFNNAWRAFWGL